MHHSYGEQVVTAEVLDELKRKAMLMEDELAIEGGRQFERTGRLNDPGLCEMSIEYENLRMDIETLEGILKQIEKRNSHAHSLPNFHLCAFICFYRVRFPFLRMDIV